MMPDILIPTYKHPSEVESFISGVKASSSAPVIATCVRASAAENRNCALNLAVSGLVIMIDDDVEGFYEGWEFDLVKPLLDDDAVKFVSARLVDRNGAMADMLHRNEDTTTPVVDVKFAPTACCAFWNDGMRFHEGYKGSGFEDTDYLMQLKTKYPSCRIVVNNECRIIHVNEMKNQVKNFHYNLSVFERRWGFQP